MKHIFQLSLIVISFYAQAQYYNRRQQNPESIQQLNSNLPPPREITIKLNPITVQNGKYFFEGRRVPFDAIVLPLTSVNDEVINHRLKTIQTLRDVFKPLFYTEVFYLTYIQINARNNYSRNAFYNILYTYIGILVFNEMYNGTITIIKRSTINRYNDVVLTPSVSPTPQSRVSLGFTIRF